MIAGVVLAAGRSSRLGRPKQLLSVHGEPLLRHTLRPILASALDAVVVVVGHESAAVHNAISDLAVRVVVNPNYSQGQSTSVHAGLQALSPEIDAAMFLLGDQPGIESALIDALIQAWRETEAPIIAPRYTDGIGNPVLFGRGVFPELTSLAGDRGARSIVRAHQVLGHLEAVAVAHPAPPDIDTETDYQALLAAKENPSPRAHVQGKGLE